jgi:hypothetical protein
MRGLPDVPSGVLAACTSVSLVLLMDRADKARREQLARLRVVAAAWPLSPRTLALPGQVLAAVPGLLVLAAVVVAGVNRGAWDRTAGQLYLGLACAAQLLLVAIPIWNERARAGAVLTAILILSAVGSELWN